MFGFSNRKKLRAKARKLLGIAKIVTTSLTTNRLDLLPVIDRFLQVRGAEGFKQIDLYMTVACVGIGMMTADVKHSQALKFLAEIIAALHEWDPGSPKLLADFQEKVLKKSQEPREAIPYIGFWILSQLSLDDSSSISKEDASAFGGMVLLSMGKWD